VPGPAGADLVLDLEGLRVNACGGEAISEACEIGTI